MIHETKRCTRCAETKPLDEFRLRGGQFRERGYRQMWCKACEPEVRRERFKAAHGVSHTHACSLASPLATAATRVTGAVNNLRAGNAARMIHCLAHAMRILKAGPRPTESAFSHLE
jgi:hypothetical protein